jgi:hypothetical protein
MNFIKSKKKLNKGQAALEFLMTYGWALLLLTVLVAGLAYIIPHPRSLAANKCVFGPSIPCLGAQFTSENLTVALRNGLGQSIYEVEANVTMPNDITCDVTPATVRADEKLTLTCNNTIWGGVNGINETDDIRIRIDLKYKKVKNGYEQLIVGEIYAKYQK